MEPTAAWRGPFELHQVATNWSAEEPTGDAQQVWAPAVGHPLQYASIVDIFGSSCCSLQPYAVPDSSISSSGGGQQQLVEYNYYNNYYAAAAQHHDPTTGKTTTTREDDLQGKLGTYMNSPDKLFQETDGKFQADAKLMETKMHRYPPSIQALGDRYTAPKVVAIGPYHHRREHLQKAVELKHVAAHHCIQEYKRVNNNCSLSVRDLYQEVVSVVAEIDARGLYDKDVMEGIDDDNDFLPMMFYDACFLVMYMLKMSGAEGDRALFDVFEASGEDIARDIMLLENQIPWQVVDAVMSKCTSEPLEKKEEFVARWKDECLQDRAGRKLPKVFLDPSDKPPHLLGLLRLHMVGKGRSRSTTKMSASEKEKIGSISISAGAIELAEMGIHLTANERAELPDMGLASEWFIFAELSMAPLSLDDRRASMLVSMAALELCTTPDFLDDPGAKPEDSAVCSYLLLLRMLTHREEDVHELRAKGVLKGAGLTNSKALEFFTGLEGLRKGRCYFDVMVEIERYRVTRWPGWLRLYAFVYNNWKYIVAVGSAVGGMISFVMTFKGSALQK